MRSDWLTLPEGRIETAWWGPGPTETPTIVLLHEGLGCVALWRDVPELLVEATGLGVFAYSRFGYGQSDPVTLPRPMTYMYHEGQVVLPQVLAAAGARDAVLVGHSDGGSIAAIYAGTVGDASLPPSRPTSTPSWPASPPSSRPASLPPSRATPTPSWPGLTGPSRASGEGDGPVEPGHDGYVHALITIAAHFFVEDLNIASIRQTKDTFETTDLRTRLARYHRDPDNAFYGWNGAWLDPRFRDFDITGFLPTIRVPTLGLQGADDPYGTDKQLRVMQESVTAPIETHLIPGARHAPHLEAKETTLDAIARFIAATVRQSVP